MKIIFKNNTIKYDKIYNKFILIKKARKNKNIDLTNVDYEIFEIIMESLLLFSDKINDNNIIKILETLVILHNKRLFNRFIKLLIKEYPNKIKELDNNIISHILYCCKLKEKYYIILKQHNTNKNLLKYNYNWINKYILINKFEIISYCYVDNNEEYYTDINDLPKDAELNQITIGNNEFVVNIFDMDEIKKHYKSFINKAKKNKDCEFLSNLEILLNDGIFTFTVYADEIVSSSIYYEIKYEHCIDALTKVMDFYNKTFV